MREKGAEIITGIRLLMKALEVQDAHIGIENNKPDAIENMRRMASEYPEIHIHPLQVKYPQGGEKQLIKAITGREVPSGGLPVDAGAIVFNVGTAFAVYEAVQKNKPLVERIVTVTGKKINQPSNFKVRIGTPVSALIQLTGGVPDDTGKIIIGGPMMGKSVSNSDLPVVKGTSGILLLPADESERNPVQPCVRCAKCVSVCPMGLEPYLLSQLAQHAFFDRLENAHVMDCVECGSCSYTCPASRPLLDYIRHGKTSVGKIIRSRIKQ
jgi:electron transport complex protein RnfC